MSQQKIGYTINKAAAIAKVSPRTLRYYDQIGLLTPERQAHNGYRRYDHQALLRLQYILFLRELDLPLEVIKSILEQPGFDLQNALADHQQALLKRRRQIDQLLATLEHTILMMKGHTVMDDHALFKGFTPEEEAHNTEEARQKWGHTDAFRQSQERYGRLTAAQKEQLMEEGNAIYKDMAAAIPFGPAGLQAQQGVARWHAHLRNFYDPSPEMMLGLGDLYNDDPRFAANINKLHPQLAEFMRQAIQEYVRSL